MGQLYLFSCKCRSPGCHGVRSFPVKAQVLTRNFTTCCICLSCKKAHFTGGESGQAALVTLLVLAALFISVLDHLCHHLPSDIATANVLPAVTQSGHRQGWFPSLVLVSITSAASLWCGCYLPQLQREETIK